MKEDADQSEEEPCCKSQYAKPTLRRARVLGAEILADERAAALLRPHDGKITKMRMRMAMYSRERSGAEDADDANEADPTGVRDGELHDASQRDTQQAEENRKLR